MDQGVQRHDGEGGGGVGDGNSRTGWRGVADAVGRVLGLKAGEAEVAACAAGYFFFVLTSYYIMRPMREQMGIARGADKLVWLMTGTMAAMVVVNPVYSWVVGRMPRRRFVPLTYRAWIVMILVFFGLFRWLPGHGGVALGYAFYVWLSVFNLFVVSVFWAVMADRFGKRAGPRVFGVVAVGGTLGAISGSTITGKLVEVLGHEWLLVAAAGALEVAVWFAMPVVRGLTSASGAKSEESGEPTRDAWAGLKLIAGSRYLGLICGYMFLFTVGSTFLYVLQGQIVEKTFTTKDAQTAAFARIDLWTNLLTLATQLVLTGRIMGWIGVRGTLLVLPAVSVAGFAALWAQPVFAVFAVFQVMRRGLHYALDRPARETLFTLVGADEKYKSKSFIDTFVYRAGDTIGGWTPTVLAWAGVAVGPVAVALAAAWLGIGVWLGRVRQKVADSQRKAERGEGARGL